MSSKLYGMKAAKRRSVRPRALAVPLPRLPSVRRFFALLAVSAFTTACGGGDSGTTGTNDNKPIAVAAEITDGSSLLLLAGGSRTLNAVALDKNGQPIAGATFTWSSSDPSVVVTNDASITGAKTGLATVTATSGSVSAHIVVTVQPGPVSQLVIRTQPTGAVAGRPLTTQPVVEFHDAEGNLVTSSANFVSASIGSGGGTLGGATTLQAVGGVVAFTDLTLTQAGPRTLTFTAGVLSATSASFDVAPSPTAFLFADSNAVSFSLQGVGDSATRVITVVNTGSQALSGMTVAVRYDSGAATGWLSAQLGTSDPPTALTLVAHGGSLAEGVYHATVQISCPGASNSPLSIGVSLAIAAPYTMSFGTPAERVKVLDIGANFAPTLSILDPSGAPKNVPVTFASRASTVATVTPDGHITAIGGGDAWIVASTPSTADSVFVIVPRSKTDPVLRTDATNFTAKAGDTVFVTVVFDARSTVVGAASLVVQDLVESGSFTGSYDVPSSTPAPIVHVVESPELLRISLGAASGFTGPVPVLRFWFVGHASPSVVWLLLTALDVSGVDGGNLTAQTTSTRLPLVIR